MKRKELVKILKRFPKDAEITVTVHGKREYVDKVEASVDRSGNWVIHIIGEDKRIKSLRDNQAKGKNNEK